MKECVRSKDHSRNTIKCGSESLVYHVTEKQSESPPSDAWQNELTHEGWPTLSLFEGLPAVVGGSCNVEYEKCTLPGQVQSAHFLIQARYMPSARTDTVRTSHWRAPRF